MAFLTSYWTIDVAFVVLSAIVAAYLYVTRHFNHWAKKGVLEALSPVPFFGTFMDVCIFRISPGEFLASLYKRARDQPYIGFYLFDRPTLVLRDPEIIKTVLIKDFDRFSNRYSSGAESDVVGSHNLFTLKNPVWRNLRRKLTPVFSSGKIKDMFPLVNAVGDDLVAHLESLNLKGNGRVVELKEVAAKYTTDTIASCAFGLRVNSLNNPEAEFRKNGEKMFEPSYRRGAQVMAIFFIPRIVNYLGFELFSSECTNFLRVACHDTISQRLKSGIRRNDFIDLLLDLKAGQKDTDDPNEYKFEGDRLVAQVAVFFAAGSETSSALISFTLHELSLYQDIQEKLREEIQTAVDENGGKLSYDMMLKLPYLDQVVHESLRKYPPLTMIEREVTLGDYVIEKTGLVLDEGTPIYVPLYGLHYDPEYFPDPVKFDPERFSEENKKKIPPYVYLPFGDGPRNCIGSRFGKVQAKLALCRILLEFQIEPCEKTLNPMRLDPKGLFSIPDGGLYHRVRKLSSVD